jgi:hypothetical protein
LSGAPELQPQVAPLTGAWELHPQVALRPEPVRAHADH